MKMPGRLAVSSWLCLLALAAFASGAAHALVPKQSTDTLSNLEFRSPRLALSQAFAPLESVQSQVDSDTREAWSGFLAAAPVAWHAVVDLRHGLIALAQGGNIGWIPGHGNSLTLASLAPVLEPGAEKKVDLAAMERIARSYLPKVAALLGVDPQELVLSLSRSGQPAGHLWNVDFDLVRAGLTVEGARVVFRVNNGNLIQFGTENLPSRGAAVPPTRLTREQALAAVAKYVGGLGPADSFSDSGSLHLLPANVPSAGSAQGFDFGSGRGLAKVWQFIFERNGVLGTWRARVDAASGEVLELADINDYATAAVSGGIYPNSPTTGAAVIRPMPFANIIGGSGGFTNSAGLYDFTAATSSTLSGQFVNIIDSCGFISQAANAAGSIFFLTSAGIDCARPTFGDGGPGNTHASRQQFYQVNRIKEVARGWLPSNTWLSQPLTVNVNQVSADPNNQCNAFWRASTGQLSFFRSLDGLCGNSGENAGISLHEFGHGLDANDGSALSDNATGESYGDITAAIALHRSCIGPGFLVANCAGYGDFCTACSGVRDIDFANHGSNTAATEANFTLVRCPIDPLSNACGREVHCASTVPSEAIWDFANRDLPSPGTGPAWAVLDRLWYLSRSTSADAYACAVAPLSQPGTQGCGTAGWYTTMRAVDDDDGNLSNGTPHGAALFAAFDRHAIACYAGLPGTSTSFRGCPQPAIPTLTVTAGNNSAALSWTASGSAFYDVFRNETGCNAGFTKISSGNSATSLTDANMANFLTYYYQVTAFPSGNEACASAPSTCVSVTPNPSIRRPIGIAFASVPDSPGGIGVERMNTFVEGSDGNLWAYWGKGWFNQGTPGGGVSIAGAVGAVSLRVFSSQLYPSYVLITGSDGNLWMNWWTGSAWRWSNRAAPVGLAASGIDYPVGAILVGGQPSVFVIGKDGNLWLSSWNGSASSWANQGTPGVRIANKVGATTVAGQPYAFVVGGDGNLWMNSLSGSAWRWTNLQAPLGVNITSGVGVTTDGVLPYIYVLGSDGNLWLNENSGGWTGAGQPAGVNIASAVGVTMNGFPSIYFLSSDGNLWLASFLVNRWVWLKQGTPPSGVNIAGTIGVATLGGTTYLSFMGADGNVWRAVASAGLMWFNAGLPVF